MSFSYSKDEWVDELRKKSQIYTRPDANQNYLRKVETSDNETDNDSGIRSIDGDSPHEKVGAGISIDGELNFSRQDSGVDMKITESKSKCSPQKNREALATTNTRLLSKNNEQVTLDFHMVDNTPENNVQKSFNNKKPPYFHSDKELQHFHPDNGVMNQEGQFLCRSKRNSFGKQYNFSDDKSESLMKISYVGKDNDRVKYPELLTTDTSIVNKGNFTEKKYDVQNERNLEIKQLQEQESRRVPSRPKQFQVDNSKQNKFTDEGNLKREEIWTKYNDLRLKLLEIVDQLLYQDLMYAQLTTEILETSLHQINTDDEMLEIKEKFLQEELFNSESLLQTFEMISERQQVESYFVLQKIKRTDSAIQEKRYLLQVLQRQFRNSKFKMMPKQLKRYCSVESLLSEAENETQEPVDTLIDVQECYEEEVSLV